MRGREAGSTATEDATDELELSLVSIRYAAGISEEPPEPEKSTRPEDLRSEISDNVLWGIAS